MRNQPLSWVGFVAVLVTASAVAQEKTSEPYGSIADLEVARPEDKQDVKSTPPPKDAIVLFDGKSTDQWVTNDGKGPIPWVLKPGGAMEVKGGGIKSKHEYAGRTKLHVEFRVPYMPNDRGQGRGNSGVYSQGRYEVQILDSYGLDSKDNDCGGIYQVAKPKVNACKAPTVWQSYDIDFTAPVFEDGKKIKPAKISVWHNGEPIHEGVEIPIDNTVSGLGGDPSKPGPVHLQDHGNPVQYRNIWIQKLD